MDISGSPHHVASKGLIQDAKDPRFRSIRALLAQDALEAKVAGLLLVQKCCDAACAQRVLPAVIDTVGVVFLVSLLKHRGAPAQVGKKDGSGSFAPLALVLVHSALKACGHGMFRHHEATLLESLAQCALSSLARTHMTGPDGKRASGEGASSSIDHLVSYVQCIFTLVLEARPCVKGKVLVQVVQAADEAIERLCGLVGGAHDKQGAMSDSHADAAPSDWQVHRQHDAFAAPAGESTGKANAESDEWNEGRRHVTHAMRGLARILCIACRVFTPKAASELAILDLQSSFRIGSPGCPLALLGRAQSLVLLSMMRLVSVDTTGIVSLSCCKTLQFMLCSSGAAAEKSAVPVSSGTHSDGEPLRAFLHRYEVGLVTTLGHVVVRAVERPSLQLCAIDCLSRAADIVGDTSWLCGAGHKGEGHGVWTAMRLGSALFPAERVAAVAAQMCRVYVLSIVREWDLWACIVKEAARGPESDKEAPKGRSAMGSERIVFGDEFGHNDMPHAMVTDAQCDGKSFMSALYFLELCIDLMVSVYGQPGSTSEVLKGKKEAKSGSNGVRQVGQADAQIILRALVETISGLSEVVMETEDRGCTESVRLAFEHGALTDACFGLIGRWLHPSVDAVRAYAEDNVCEASTDPDTLAPTTFVERTPSDGTGTPSSRQTYEDAFKALDVAEELERMRRASQQSQS